MIRPVPLDEREGPPSHQGPAADKAPGEATVANANNATVEHRLPPQPDAATLDFPATDPNATVDWVRSGVSGLSARPTGLTDLPAGTVTLPGYEVLGVLGRGAMGVVYKARQRGLNRLVALKMILAGEHASEGDLARFRCEAEAVAHLQHPHIVQIYEVGEDHGRPYFSLEYVEGSSLDKKCAGTPLPPAEAARLVRQLAEAMAYAHANGIIHRDLKPGNVLIGEPAGFAKGAEQVAARGLDTSVGQWVPKITDFGLAKRIEEDANQTRTGTVLGTPSYMAPEQAEGRIREVGPLADVYSLGAILYELLTGRPPFRGATVLDTLQQLRTQEPVPPTQFQPGVPHNLETICLKCLHKEAGKRYASAGALADDLKRYLAGEPIQARPVGRVERLWRWCRRNPRIAVLTAAVTLLVVAWAVTSSVLAWRLKVQKDATDQARQESVRQAALAQRNMEEAQREAILAQQNAQWARDTADKAYQRLVDLGGKLLTRLQSKRLSIQGTPEVRQLREEVLALLRQSLSNASKQLETNGLTSFAQAATCQRLGDLLARLGQNQEARQAYQQGHDLVKRVVTAEPDNDLARANLGVMLLRLGNIALDPDGDARTAHDRYTQARDLHQEILTKPHSQKYTELDLKRILSHDDVSLGKALLALGDPAAARQCFQESLTYRRAWVKATAATEAVSYEMEARMWLGVVSWHLGDAKAVQEHFAEAVRIGEDLVRQFPKDLSFKEDMAVVHGNQGDAWLRSGKPEEADKSYRESLRILEGVIAAQPDEISRQPLLAGAHERLAAVNQRLGKSAEAEKHYQEALRLRTELLQLEPNNPSRQAHRLLALAHGGKQADAAAGAAKVRLRVANSPVLLLQLARCWAICAAADTPQKRQYTEQTLEALRAATGEDYKDTVALQTDPDLETLRGDPAFRTVLGQVGGRQANKETPGQGR